MKNSTALRLNRIFPAVLISALFFVNDSASAQSGNKYATGLNSLTATDGLGSYNYEGLNFYTNAVKRGAFTKDGEFEALYKAHFYADLKCDSIIKSWKAQTDNLRVFGNAVIDSTLQAQRLEADALSIAGNANIADTLNIGLLTLTGNRITSSNGTISFSGNNLVKAGTLISSTVDAQTYLLSGTAIDFNAMDSTDKALQVQIDSIETAVGGITSSQWQNTSPNSISYTGNATVNGTFQANNINTALLTISDKFTAPKGEFDTLRAERQLSINHNLKLGRDSGSITESDIASKIDVLKIQSDPNVSFDVVMAEGNEAKIGIGVKEGLTAKLNVLGGTRLNGDLQVTGNSTFSGDIISQGTIEANTINASNINLNGTPFSGQFLRLSGDTMKGNITFDNNSALNHSSSNALLRFNNPQGENIIGLGYNMDDPATQQGFLIAPSGYKGNPNGSFAFGDANPNGQIILALGTGQSGTRINLDGAGKRLILQNDGGDKFSMGGVNALTLLETTQGINISPRSGFAFTGTHLLDIQGSVNAQQYYINGNLVDVAGIDSTLDTLQTIVDSFQSSQWQNDTVSSSNIFYSQGYVGIGTSQPSVPLEVSGSLKITGSDTTGSGGGSGGGGAPPPPAPSKSIIIDGGLDRITATSGTIDFVNTNLTTTGSIQSNSMTTSNLTITDLIKTKSAEFDTLRVVERMEVEKYIQSDTLHALSSLEVNNSLKLVRDTAVMYAEMSTKDTAVALMLQKEPTAEVTIGEALPPAPGEARAKLTVVGNTKLDGSVNVSGNLTTAGNVTANCVTTSCLNVSGQTTFDSLLATTKIKTARIVPLDGDSMIRFGNSTLFVNANSHFISTNNDKGFSIGWLNNYDVSTYQNALAIGHLSWAEANNAISIGNASRAKGSNSIVIGSEFTNAHAPHSMAMGYQVETDPASQKSIVIGSGSSNYFINDKPNSLMVGFNTWGNTPTLFVGSASGTQNSIGEVGIGTSAPSKTLDVAGTFRSRSDATFDTKIILETNSKIEHSTSTAKLSFDNLGTPNVISLGYGNAISNFQGLGILPVGTSGNPNGSIILGDLTNSPGDIVLTVGDVMQGTNEVLVHLDADNERINVRNGQGDDLTIEGVNGPTQWNAPLGIKLLGNIGIGNTPFDQKLNVDGDVNVTAGNGYRINNTAPAGQYLRGDGTHFTASAIDVNDIPSNSNSYVQNQTGTAQTGGFNISGNGILGGNAIINGNVGIGTTSPNYELNIYNPSAGFQQHSSIQLTNYTTENLSTDGLIISTRFSDAIFNLAEDGNMNFKIGQTPVTAMTINYSGNIGIGGSPQDKFHVFGNGIFNGNIGIGTLTPSEKLDVDGFIKSSSLSSGSGNSIVTADASGKLGILPFSGSGAPFWGTTGNSGTNPSTDFIGTNDANDLSFKTNDIERMRILSGGNIGIGTNDPKNNVHIHSDANIVSTAYVSPFNGVGPPIGTTVGTSLLQMTNKTTGITNNDGLLLGTYENEAFLVLQELGTMKFATNDSTRMTIAPHGDIGMGTKFPKSFLHLHQKTTDPMYMQITNVLTGDVANDGLKIGINDAGTAEFIQQHNAPMDFKTAETPGGTPQNRMTILSNGNIGIGTTNPEKKLDVRSRINVRGPGYANTEFTGIELINDGTDMWSRVDICFKNIAPTYGNLCQFLQNEGSSNSFLMRNQQAGGVGQYLDYINLNLTNNDITFNSQKTSGATYGDVIIANGSVGIGTASPIQSLDINGRMNVSNGVIQRGGAAITGTSDLGLYSRVSGNWMRFVTNNASIRFYSDDGIGTTANMTIQPDGKVGIGTDAPGAELDVIGMIRTCEAKINLSSSVCPPDFVFENTYNLFSLKKRRDIVLKNKHLLYINSGNEMKKNGLLLSEFSLGILQNVEEHELYLYDHDEKITLLISENKELKSKIDAQDKKMEEMQKKIDKLLNKN